VTFEPGAAGFSLRTNLITTLKSWIDGPVPRRRPISSVVVGARGFELQTSCAQGGSVTSGKSFLSIFLLKQKDLAEAFGSGTMCGNVPPHAWSPPNFPHSEMTSKGAPIGSNFLVRTDASVSDIALSENRHDKEFSEHPSHR
jgi:hypothetical protein